MIKETYRRFKAKVIDTEIAFACKGYNISPGIRLPDFMGIGSPISASTWLANNLHRHPEVAMSTDKETKFFSNNLDRGLRWYSSQFSDDRNLTVGEFTPSYGRLPLDRIKLIRQLVPDVRLLLTIRHPVDRAWAGARRTMSMMSKYWNCSIEEIPKKEFEKYFAIEAEYQADILGRGGNFVPGLKSGEYSKILGNWLSVFPDEQLLIIFFDDIKKDPQKVLESVFDHIGVSLDVDFSRFSIEPANSNQKIQMPEWARMALHQMYEPELQRLESYLGKLPSDWY